MRQHDPILGVVLLKLSDILQTSSQVTRWYPLDGGIGFGRIRIFLLFRSVETGLPPQQLGWDVGTFEFTSNRILATGYNANSKLKLKTGGSSGKIPRTQCQKIEEGDGVFGILQRRKARTTSGFLFDIDTAHLLSLSSVQRISARWTRMPLYGSIISRTTRKRILVFQSRRRIRA
jgi:hypothetical protein